MLYILFQLYLSIDLLPPFVKEWDDSIGAWHSFGDAASEENKIMLVPKIQSTVGSLWNDAILPITNWSVEFNITINDPGDFGGFAIWYIDEMDVLGPFYGGSPTFSGICIIGSINKVENEKIYLDIHCVQSESDSTDWISAALPKPQASMWLNDNETTFSLIFEIIEDKINFYTRSKNENSVKIESQTVKDNMYFNYLGITALNDQYSTNININNIKFDPRGTAKTVDAKFDIARTLSSLEIKRNYPFARKKTEFRSPQFQSVSLDKEIARKVDGDVTYFINTNISDAFKMISKCLDVALSLATYKDLDSIVNSNFNMFSQKWAKRKMKLSMNTQIMNQTIASTMNKTEALINIFKGTIHESLVHSKKKAVHFNEILEEMNETELISLGETISGTSLGEYLIWISIAEVAIAFCLLSYTSNDEKEHDGNIYSPL